MTYRQNNPKYSLVLQSNLSTRVRKMREVKSTHSSLSFYAHPIDTKSSVRIHRNLNVNHDRDCGRSMTKGKHNAVKYR